MGSIDLSIFALAEIDDFPHLWVACIHFAACALQSEKDTPREQIICFIHEEDEIHYVWLIIL